MPNKALGGCQSRRAPPMPAKLVLRRRQSACVILLRTAGRSGIQPFACARAQPRAVPERPRGAVRGASPRSGNRHREGRAGDLAAAGPLAISVAPAARARAAASRTAGRLSSSDAIAQTGKSPSRAASGPWMKSVAVSGSAATRQVSSSFSEISRAWRTRGRDRSRTCGRGTRRRRDLWPAAARGRAARRPARRRRADSVRDRRALPGGVAGQERDRRDLRGVGLRGSDRVLRPAASGSIGSAASPSVERCRW